MIDQYNATRWRMRRAISLQGVAASGTLPDVLPAQVISDTVFPTCKPGQTVIRNGYYWDGLYSQNPPVRDLLDASTKEEKPDEIWVVRINPQELHPSSLNIGIDDIRDRENDLAGNLSLNQELDHIMTINRWIEEYGDSHPPLNNRKIVQLRTIKMTRDTAWGLKYTSKFDRDSGHLAEQRGPEGCRAMAGGLAGARQRLRLLSRRRALSGTAVTGPALCSQRRKLGGRRRRF